MCGVEASDCSTEQLGSCPRTDISEEQCNGNLGGPGSDNVRCFVEGSVCNQTTNTQGACGPGTVTGCSTDDDCDQFDTECTQGVCISGDPNFCVSQPLPG